MKKSQNYSLALHSFLCAVFTTREGLEILKKKKRKYKKVTQGNLNIKASNEISCK